MEKSIKELLEFSILNLDKPSGPTSFDISDLVRKKLGLRKTSHLGTLDPKVTGVLPIALNRGCKLTGFLIGHDKEYVGIMRFHEPISKEKIEEAIKRKFLGKIIQMPPVKSSVKRQLREREVYSFEILEEDGNDKDFLFKAKVQGGTYIRKLIDDLGKELGINAHMLELRRTQAGIFSEQDKNFVNLYELEKAIDEGKLKDILTPAEEAIKKIFPVVEIKEESIKRLYTGKQFLESDLMKKKSFKVDELIAAFSGEKFVGIYKILKPGKEKIFAKPQFVLQPI